MVVVGGSSVGAGGMGVADGVVAVGAMRGRGLTQISRNCSIVC